MNKETERNLTMLLIFFALIVMGFFVFRFINAAAEMNKHPLQAGALQMNIASCDCITDDSAQLYFNKTATWTVHKNSYSPPTLRMIP